MNLNIEKAKEVVAREFNVDASALEVETCSDKKTEKPRFAVYLKGDVGGNVKIYQDRLAAEEAMVECYIEFMWEELEEKRECIDVVASVCDLSELSHWIVSEGRSKQLSEEELKVCLGDPLKTLKEWTSHADTDFIMNVLFDQCSPDDKAVGLAYLRSVGGLAGYEDTAVYFETVEGFCIEVLYDTEEQGPLLERARARRDRP